MASSSESNFFIQDVLGDKNQVGGGLGRRFAAGGLQNLGPAYFFLLSFTNPETKPGDVDFPIGSSRALGDL